MNRAGRLYATSRGLFERPLSFDVVSIDWSEGRPRVRRVRRDGGAFDADGE